MTVAEIHGKISSTGSNLTDRMEDLLTSDVFGTCKYLQPRELLIPFLKTSTSLDGHQLAVFLEDDIISVNYMFWPRLTKTEPDLLLQIQTDTEKDLLVMIEAKYLSGKSSASLDEYELEIASAPSDQLAKEYWDLVEYAKLTQMENQKENAIYLVYVTAHRSIPVRSLIETQNEIRKFHNQDVRVYWTSWIQLSQLLCEQVCDVNPFRTSNEMKKDLLFLLERKGLVRFTGVGMLEIPEEVRWRYHCESKLSNSSYSFSSFPTVQLLEWHYQSATRQGSNYNWDTLEEVLDMGKEGMKIKTLLGEVMKVYMNSSTLLSDAESIIQEKGFKCLNSGRGVSTERSSRRDLTYLWSAPYAALYFEEEASSLPLVRAIGVFFADMRTQAPIEPIVVYGVIQLPEEESRSDWKAWYLKEGWYNSVEVEGSEIRFLEKEIQFGQNSFGPGRFGSVQLDEITDYMQVEEKIIKPLLELNIEKK